MKENRKSNGVGAIWYDKTRKEWNGSVLIRHDDVTGQQLRKSFAANTKQELLVQMNHFRSTVTPVFLY